jgi:hypothetical protein
LTVEQSKTLLSESPDSLRGKRDRATLALLIGCGLRRAELVGLRMEDLQVREEHSVIADLIESWQSIHFPYKTAAEVDLPEEGQVPSTFPYVMASGTFRSHVMIEH